VAAGEVGDPAPLTFLTHELGKHGQLPSGEEVQRILSDARTAHALLPSIEEAPPRRSTPGGRVLRCMGVSRTLPR
jgi:hypothetical protein